MIRNELENFKNLWSKYIKNPYFLVWNVIAIYVFWRLRYAYILLILVMIIRCLFILTAKNPIIYLSESKINLFFNYMLINFLKSIQNSKFNKDTIFYIFFLFMFRAIIGIGYRFIRMSVVMFDCLHREYTWANIKKKKKNLKIIKKYFQNSYENFLFIEFVKSKPNTNNNIYISFRYFKKTIKIKTQSYRNNK